jgi:hypothetical protein
MLYEPDGLVGVGRRLSAFVASWTGRRVPNAG